MRTKNYVREHLNTIGEGEKIHNLLMISGCDENNNNRIHVVYIKYIQKYSKLHICPKCGYIPPATNNKSYH
jgi:rubrerythrin